LTFDLDIRTRARFWYMHLTTKLHRHTFNRSEVIVLTNIQTDATENVLHLAPLCYAGAGRQLRQLVLRDAIATCKSVEMTVSAVHVVIRARKRRR